MAFLGFHHVQLAMPPGRERDAAAFYCEVLGFKQIPRPAHLAARGGGWFRSDHVELHLGDEDPFVPARKAHPALLVSDLEHVRGALTDAGIEIVLDTQLEGHERFSAHDPFGNRLEFIRARVSPG